MSKKNNKKRLRRKHQQDIQREKDRMKQIKENLIVVQERAVEERLSRTEMADEAGRMAVEGIRKTIKKRKFKIFQKRLLKQAKRRRKVARKAPLIVHSRGMAVE